MISFKGTKEVLEERYGEESPEEEKAPVLDPLVSHISQVFQRNKDARRDSGCEEEMLIGLRMVGKQYSDDELKLIEEQGGSDIYMPIGNSKIRALIGWTKDILANPRDWPFSIRPTTVPELPQETVAKITDTVTKQFSLVNPKEGEALADQWRQEYELRRDMKDTILQQVEEEAYYSFKLQDKKIKDQLEEGNWHKALAEFIDDFAVFPTAIMKGPMIKQKPGLTWVRGLPVEEYRTIYDHKRVNPLDYYPDPSTDDIQKGENIELIRVRPESLAAMRGEEGWISESISEVIANGEGLGQTWQTEIEHEKAQLEKRGYEFEANEGLHIGFHYFGALPVEYLEMYNIEDIPESNSGYLEAEIIMFGGTIVKAQLNDDPLLRRPYYAASYQTRPGAFWGMSLPVLLDPIQRMCNACARNLVNNMALSARPITGVNIDRLADDGDIEELQGGDIFQFTSDPYGQNTGAPLQFFSFPSNASELLAVYDHFENKADDASMIPKYAYGGQNVQGAAATAAGLAMLMESASKGIKEAIRHIDVGLLKPRIEFQFYYNMLNEPLTEFSGDIKVVTRGSDTLAIKGAQELRRNEFLQITGNALDQSILGKNGRAAILREIAKDLGFAETPVPNRLELKLKEQREAELAQKQAEQGDRSLQATKLQVDGQVAMHKSAKEVDIQKLEWDKQKFTEEMRLEREELQKNIEVSVRKAVGELAAKDKKIDSEMQMKDKELATEIVKSRRE